MLLRLHRVLRGLLDRAEPDARTIISNWDDTISATLYFSWSHRCDADAIVDLFSLRILRSRENEEQAVISVPPFRASG
jgi:hypothetical protein